MNIKTKKIPAYILLIAMTLNVFSAQILAQKNELYLKHELTDYLNF
jgi:hypothetical protein